MASPSPQNSPMPPPQTPSPMGPPAQSPAPSQSPHSPFQGSQIHVNGPLHNITSSNTPPTSNQGHLQSNVHMISQPGTLPHGPSHSGQPPLQTSHSSGTTSHQGFSSSNQSQQNIPPGSSNHSGRPSNQMQTNSGNTSVPQQGSILHLNNQNQTNPTPPIGHNLQGQYANHLISLPHSVQQTQVTNHLTF